MKNSFVLITILIGLFTQSALHAEQRKVIVGILTDGPKKRDILPWDLLRKEIDDLLGKDFSVQFPDDKQRDGGWTLTGVRQTLDKLLADPEVDVVMAMGFFSSHEASKVGRLSKPVIAPYIAEVKLQDIPFKDGVSGKENFLYLCNYRSVENEIMSFQEMVGFHHLAVLVDSIAIEAIPDLKNKFDRIQEQLNIEIDLISVSESVEQALASLSQKTEAAYLSPLPRFTEDDITRLAAGLIQRELPSFALLGRREVELGFLMSTTGLTHDYVRIARRLAIDLQRILLGEDAGTIDVAFEPGRQLTINMSTARAVGYSPRWADLADAEVLFSEDEERGPPLSLAEAMEIAAGENLDLAAVEYSVRIAEDEEHSARSPLFPQLDVAISNSNIDQDRANPFEREHSTDGELTGSQLIYSEKIWSKYRIAQYLRDSTDYEFKTAALDTLQEAATAYLNVLLAGALQGVRHSNVGVTRKNLDLARVRRRVGYSGRADVLRWESQIAIDRQELLAAEADREQSETALKRILHKAQDEEFVINEGGIGSFLSVLEGTRFQSFVDSPVGWDTFLDFNVEEALENAPEIGQADALVWAQDRQVTEAKRAFFVPDISVQSRYNQNFDRSGSGESIPGMSVNDDEWSVFVQASLPIFTGGALRADLSQSRNALRQVGIQRESIKERVEARILSALEQVSGSFPAIALSEDAAKAAEDNLDLVTDSYSKGAVSVTDLIDAQDAALSAKLSAAEARYAFLIDFVEVMRAAGDFSLLLEAKGFENWFGKLDAYYDEHRVGHTQRK